MEKNLKPIGLCDSILALLDSQELLNRKFAVAGVLIELSSISLMLVGSTESKGILDTVEALSALGFIFMNIDLLITYSKIKESVSSNLAIVLVGSSILTLASFVIYKYSEIELFKSFFLSTENAYYKSVILTGESVLIFGLSKASFFVDKVRAK